MCSQRISADNLYLLDPASLESLLEHHYPAAQPAPTPFLNKVHYARQDPEDTIVTNSGVDETLSYDDVAPPHTPSPPASLSITLTRDEDTSTDGPRTVAGPPIPPTTTSTSSAPPSLPTVCPACPDSDIVTLADGSKCEQCLRDGSRGSWTNGVTCQSVNRGEGTLPDSSSDGRPTACLGTGDTPNTRTCLEGCNSMLLLAQSSNPCSPNIIPAANTCKNCVSGGAILTSLDGSGSGGFADNFDSYLGSLRNWCASSKKINLDTGRSIDAASNDNNNSNDNNGADPTTNTAATTQNADTQGSSPSSSSTRSNGNARKAAVTQSLSTATAVSVIVVTDAQGQTSLSTSTTLATITASIATSATSDLVKALGPVGTAAPTSSPGQSGRASKLGAAPGFASTLLLGASLVIPYL